MISKEIFFQQFVEAAEIDTEIELALDSNFRDFDEWSSLAGLCVMQMMTELTGKPFTVSDIKNCNTLGDLYKYIEANENH